MYCYTFFACMYLKVNHTLYVITFSCHSIQKYIMTTIARLRHFLAAIIWLYNIYSRVSKVVVDHDDLLLHLRYSHSSYNAVLLQRGILSNTGFFQTKNHIKILSNSVFSEILAKKPFLGSLFPSNFFSTNISFFFLENLQQSCVTLQCINEKYNKIRRANNNFSANLYFMQ